MTRASYSYPLGTRRAEYTTGGQLMEILSQPPAVVRQVFAAFPPGAAAGPEKFPAGLNGLMLAFPNAGS